MTVQIRTPAATFKSQCMRRNVSIRCLARSQIKSTSGRDNRSPHVQRRRSPLLASEAARSTDVVNHVFEPDPKNYREAIKSTQCLNWKKVMEEELEAIEANDLERRKSRLVACGNEQSLSVYFFLTFAAVMVMSTVKVILALAATWEVPAQQGDIPNAYFKASKEPHLEILLHIPNGMDVPATRMRELGVTSTKDLALELRKSLDGLK
ncbi:unnamed protein product [Peronospora farinosa]|uniref:Uncharacterized protein n=1 Tax=Peronospora farinosa TaxID=134698 RepID=A0AAV0TWQ8_9STRA|nr:unnamed protein product [Peronospora farinosa]